MLLKFEIQALKITPEVLYGIISMYMTHLKAQIVSVQDSDTAEYEPGCGAGLYPERTDFLVCPLNCTPSQFSDAILHVDEAIARSSLENHFSDIGGSQFRLEEGSILSISWEAYFNSWLDTVAKHHRNALQVFVDDSLQRQDIFRKDETEE